MKKYSDTTDRRRSRELALHTLYAREVDPSERWEDILESIASSDHFPVAASERVERIEKIKSYASKLVSAALSNLPSIDAMISAKAANWELRRMAAVDRNVLRLAAGELVFSDDAVPYKVVIDEAVEIAKTYGTDDSGKFVNGILDSIRKDLNKQ